MIKEIMPISAYTPPPNGSITIDGVTKKAYKSFQTEERYREYRECGFTEIAFSGEDSYNGEPFGRSRLKKLMDLAQKTDLKAVVVDKRLVELTESDDAKERYFGGNAEKLNAYVRDCMKDYALHPAFYGVGFRDEPSYSHKNSFLDVSAAVLKVKKCFIHTCLVPFIQDQGMREDVFGTDISDKWLAYKRYLKTFGHIVGYINYDCYPFGFWDGKNIVAHEFVRNMQFVSRIADEENLDFNMTIQSFSSGAREELRHVDEYDFNWQTNLALGFGVKKINYFTYWRFLCRQSDCFTSAIIDDDGTRLSYDGARANNMLLQKTARYVYGYKYDSTDIIRGGHGNDSTEELSTVPCEFIVNASAQADTLVNTLHRGNDKALMLLNLRDPYEKCANIVHIELAGKKEKNRIVKGGELLEAEFKDGKADFALSPGEAVWILDL